MTIDLDDYERDNLLSLLILCGANHTGLQIAPFTLMNTGDWLNQVYFKLTDNDTRPRQIYPNVPVVDMHKRVEEWVKWQLQENNTLLKDIINR